MNIYPNFIIEYNDIEGVGRERDGSILGSKACSQSNDTGEKWVHSIHKQRNHQHCWPLITPIRSLQMRCPRAG